MDWKYDHRRCLHGVDAQVCSVQSILVVFCAVLPARRLLAFFWCCGGICCRATTARTIAWCFRRTFLHAFRLCQGSSGDITERCTLWRDLADRTATVEWRIMFSSHGEKNNSACWLPPARRQTCTLNTRFVEEDFCIGWSFFGGNAPSRSVPTSHIPRPLHGTASPLPPSNRQQS